MIPGKLYVIANCPWAVFDCPSNGKVYSVESGEVLLFIKKEQIPNAYDGTGPHANPLYKYIFLHEDTLLETIANGNVELFEKTFVRMA
jgi:hypothetical protein